MKKFIIILSLLVFSGFATSAPIKFNFIFLEDGGTARTAGYIIYEDTLLSNPGDNSFGIPNAAILDLYVVVTGTAGGDGLFTLNNLDFIGVAFNTGGLALDFSRELVGQPTDGDPWGTVVPTKTTYDLQGLGRGSDFNLFSNAQQPPAKNTNSSKGIIPAPTGASPFVLRAASGELMAITSFSAHIPIIPTLNNSSLIIIALMLVLFGFYHIRKTQTN